MMNDDEEWFQAMEENESQSWWFIQDQDDEWVKRQLGGNDDRTNTNSSNRKIRQ